METKRIDLSDSDLSVHIVKKLKRDNIAKLSELLQLDEDKLLQVASRVFLRRKEIDDIKQYIFSHFPDRFSVDFCYLPQSKSIIKQEEIIKEVTIQEVLTASEASALWGLESSVVRKSIERGKFQEGEYRKSGGTWLVTYPAMERVFGEIKEKESGEVQ